MTTSWFLLAAVFAATYIFNTGVSVTPAVKSVVNIVAIILVGVIALFATGVV